MRGPLSIYNVIYSIFLYAHRNGGDIGGFYLEVADLHSTGLVW